MRELAAPPAEIVELVAALQPYWGGEAEVIRTYFDSPFRSRATDRVWLARQCHKELVDGVDARMAFLKDSSRCADPAERRRLARDAVEEFHHYRLFASVHDALGAEDAAPLEPAVARTEYGWPANDALRQLRDAHSARYGRLGWRALLITEGGSGVLYAAGAALAGRSADDDLIAAACQKVLHDEAGHVLQGLVGNDARSDHDPHVLRNLCVEQSAARIPMRNEQLGNPVTPDRLAVLVAGGGKRVAFDWPQSCA